MSDEELEYAVTHATMHDPLYTQHILHELFIRQQKIMKVLQTHVTPQVMELILNA